MSERPPLERRALPHGATVDTTSARPALVGYAVHFNELSEPITGPHGAAFRERVRPSALARLRERRDVKALVGHDAARVVGSTKAGTLTLQVDSIGLRFRLEPPDSPIGADLLEAVRRGDMDAMSFAFRVLPDGETWSRDERPPVRELTDIDVFEISFVAWGAYRTAAAHVEQRALEEAARITVAARLADRATQLRAFSAQLRDVSSVRPIT